MKLATEKSKQQKDNMRHGELNNIIQKLSLNLFCFHHSLERPAVLTIIIIIIINFIDIVITVFIAGFLDLYKLRLTSPEGS